MRRSGCVGWLLLSFAVGLNANASDLVDAIKKGDSAGVRNLVRQRVDVNIREADGSTALHWAAYRNDHEAADLLVRAGAQVNATNDLGVTPLWIASSEGSAEMVGQLLAAGADPNLGPRTGGTALMKAVRTGNEAAVVHLLDHGADVNATEGNRGQTALMWAVTQHHPRVVQRLLKAGANIEARSAVWRQFVLLCCQANNGDGSGSTWMKQGGFTPLLFAARVGDVEAAQLLLGVGADVNAASPEGATPLTVAALSGHGTLAAMLLEKGANPNAADAGYTALHAAVLRDDLNLVKVLLARGADPNARLTKATPARRAARDFAFYGSWVGATPFWMAAGFHKPGLLRLLKANGADPALTIADGTTPLMAAARGESPRALFQDGDPVLPPGEEAPTLETIKALIELGAAVNVANQAGDTALHRAASKRFNTVVQFLVDQGAPLHARDRQGRTPLACATSHCHLLTDTKGAFVAATFEQAVGGAQNSTVDLLRILGAKQ